jgi:hypothetical protein
MPSYLKEPLALLLFIAIGVLIVLQVDGSYGNLPKYIFGGLIAVGLFCLRYAKIRPGNLARRRCAEARPGDPALPTQR